MIKKAVKRNNILAQNKNSKDIAIIGMAGRFPGASTLLGFWENLSTGTCSINFFTKETLISFGVRPETIEHPYYVKATGIIEDVDKFDEYFFGYTPLEAAIMDPQHRVFMEVVYEALENAGYAPNKYDGAIGIFAGMGDSNYFTNNILPNQEILNSFGLWEAKIATSSQFLANKVSYKLNLKGPCVNINTGCSTSLVNVIMACESLEHHQCDIAIAGGISLVLPNEVGYIYRGGGILSMDGNCRTFDKDATGTVPSSGVGVVILKRLDEALKFGANVLAVIKGTSINNDGHSKAGFTAPSVEGQRKCIVEAQIRAKVFPSAVNYIEAHGTGTQLGDAIEIQALKEAFATNSARKQPCALGSVKPNIGHTDSAAGVASLIKTTLCLQNKMLVPHIGCQESLPEINSQDSPFFINKKLIPWKRINLKTPLKAGVSSFGIGGTNSHIVLEEADHLKKASSNPLRSKYILVYSAKTMSALEQIKANILSYMKRKIDLNLSEEMSEREFADFIYTLQIGREDFPIRVALVCQGFKDAIAAIEKNPSRLKIRDCRTNKAQGVVFMFSSLDGQYVNTVHKLYQNEPDFKLIIDTCFNKIFDKYKINLKNIIFVNDKYGSKNILNNIIKHKHLILFIIEYSLASLIMSWGIIPDAMIGYSVGEYVAACLAQTISLSDALELVFLLDEFIEKETRGAMLEVPLSQRDILPFLNSRVSLAAVNAPSLCVVSGSNEDIFEFEKNVNELLTIYNLQCRHLNTTHALHSHKMAVVAERLKEILKSVKFNKPILPYLSSMTGDWITQQEINDLNYWRKHLFNTVQFSRGIRTLQDSGDYLYLEVAPKSVLASFVRQHTQANQNNIICICSDVNNIEVKGEKDGYDNDTDIYDALANLWTCGISINWHNLYKHEKRHRIPLPTYPFEKKTHWINAISSSNGDDNGYFIKEISKECPISPCNVNFTERKHLTNYQSPRDEIEQILVQIWETIFSTQPIGIFDDFFELGGHSLLAVQLVSIIREKCKVEVPIKHIFEHPTISHLGEFVRDFASQENNLLLAPIVALPNRESTPLSFIQEQFWFLEQTAGEEGLYNISIVISLTGKLNTKALLYAFNMLIERHEILRTAIELVNKRPSQIVKKGSDISFPFDYIDLSKLSKSEKQEEFSRLGIIESTKPFNLSSGILIRGQLLRFGRKEHILTISVHHAVCDGWSIDILFKELSEFYNAYQAGQIPKLAKLPIQYADFTIWQRNWLQKNVLNKQLSYWKEQLKGIPLLLDLPIDKVRPRKQTYRGTFYYFSLPKSLLNEIKAFTEKHEVTFFMAMLAAYSVLLYRYCAQTDIVIGSPVANRHYPNVEGLIGCFINMLALRTDCSGDPTFVELLHRVRKVTLSAYEHRDIPFKYIVNHLSINRTLAWNPIFQTVLYIQTNNDDLFQLDGLKAEIDGTEICVSKFDLSLWIREREDQLALGFEYATDLFETKTIKQMAKSFRNLLQAIASNPDQKISEIPLIISTERPHKRKSDNKGTISPSTYDETIYKG